MNSPQVVERRYLVTGKIPSQRKNAPPALAIGFLSIGGTRDVFLVRQGSLARLGTRERQGTSHRETFQTMTTADFDALWPLTEGARLEKTVRHFKHQGYPFTVETLGTGPTALPLASVWLPDLIAADFQKPDWLGAEVSGLEEYTDASIALHGPPSPRDSRTQIGAVPFLFKSGVLHLVLVTSSSGQLWIIPKGRLEPGMSHEEVALMEAAEEAGAVGVIEPTSAAQCVLQGGRTLHLYPLRVAVLLPTWPERAERRRVVLPVYRALMRIRDPGLERCLRDMSRRLVP
jgi:CYTH domain-containing protein/8-oxo-dGTP pyrophosphatase MutT (NUDIX family)